MFCGTCGTQHADNARFCPGCGAIRAAPGGGESPRPAGARRLKLPRYLLPAVAALLVVGGTGYAGWRYAQTKAAEKPASSWPIVVTVNGKCGAIDSTGKYVLNPNYEGLSDISDSGLAAFRQGNLWGFVDTTGKVVIPPSFDTVQAFGPNALAAVQTGGSWGFIDRAGKLVIQPQYQNAFAFEQDGGAWVQQGELWGRIDKFGRYVIPPRFAAVQPFAFGLAPVEVGKMWGMIDPSGTEAISPRFEMVSAFNANGVASVSLGGKMGLIDRTGNLLIPPIYDWMTTSDDDIFAVRKGTKQGYVDQTGKLVIPLMFDGAGSFDGADLAPVQNANAKWGYIDRTGKFVIAPNFDWTDAYHFSHAIVQSGKLFGLIDGSGSLVVPAGYLTMVRRVRVAGDAKVEYLDTILAQAPNGKWGVMSPSGKMLIAPRFDAIGCETEQGE